MRQNRVGASPHRTSIPPRSQGAATQRVSDIFSFVFDMEYADYQLKHFILLLRKRRKTSVRPSLPREQPTK